MAQYKPNVNNENNGGTAPVQPCTMTYTVDPNTMGYTNLLAAGMPNMPVPMYQYCTMPGMMPTSPQAINYSIPYQGYQYTIPLTLPMSMPYTLQVIAEPCNSDTNANLDETPESTAEDEVAAAAAPEIIQKILAEKATETIWNDLNAESTTTTQHNIDLNTSKLNLRAEAGTHQEQEEELEQQQTQRDIALDPYLSENATTEAQQQVKPSNIVKTKLIQAMRKGQDYLKDTHTTKFIDILANTISPIPRVQCEKPSAFRDIYMENQKPKAKAKKLIKSKKQQPRNNTNDARFHLIKLLTTKFKNFTTKSIKSMHIKLIAGKASHGVATRKTTKQQTMPPIKIEVIPATTTKKKNTQALKKQQQQPYKIYFQTKDAPPLHAAVLQKYAKAANKMRAKSGATYPTDTTNCRTANPCTTLLYTNYQNNCNGGVPQHGCYRIMRNNRCTPTPPRMVYMHTRRSERVQPSSICNPLPIHINGDDATSNEVDYKSEKFVCRNMLQTNEAAAATATAAKRRDDKMDHKKKDQQKNEKATNDKKEFTTKMPKNCKCKKQKNQKEEQQKLEQPIRIDGSHEESWLVEEIATTTRTAAAQQELQTEDDELQNESEEDNLLEYVALQSDDEVEEAAEAEKENNLEDDTESSSEHSEINSSTNTSSSEQSSLHELTTLPSFLILNSNHAIQTSARIHYSQKQNQIDLPRLSLTSTNISFQKDATSILKSHSSYTTTPLIQSPSQSAIYEKVRSKEPKKKSHSQSKSQNESKEDYSNEKNSKSASQSIESQTISKASSVKTSDESARSKISNAKASSQFASKSASQRSKHSQVKSSSPIESQIISKPSSVKTSDESTRSKISNAKASSQLTSKSASRHFKQSQGGKSGSPIESQIIFKASNVKTSDESTRYKISHVKTSSQFAVKSESLQSKESRFQTDTQAEASQQSKDTNAQKCSNCCNCVESIDPSKCVSHCKFKVLMQQQTSPQQQQEVRPIPDVDVATTTKGLPTPKSIYDKQPSNYRLRIHELDKSVYRRRRRSCLDVIHCCDNPSPCYPYNCCMAKNYFATTECNYLYGCEAYRYCCY